MRQADWYFDFISPFSYFGLLRLAELPADLQIRPRPVLFAGLLNHWGQKGPAELSSKRLWTYRSCVWYATQNGIAFRFPASHPFNPLPYLRAVIAAGNSVEAISTIFRALWTTAADPADPQVLDALLRQLQIDPSRLVSSEVKEALRTSTQGAIEQGVFGVPTLAIDDQLFWGADSTDFAKAYLADPAMLASGEMQRAATLPVGVSR